MNNVIVKLTYLQGKKDILSFSLPKGINPMVGREEATNDIVIHHPTVSRVHARLFIQEGKVHVQDLNSSCGTLVDEVPTRGLVEIRSGSIIAFGQCRFRIFIGPWRYEEAMDSTLSLKFP